LKSIKLLNGKGASTFPAINHDGKRIVMNRRQTFSIISFTAVSTPDILNSLYAPHNRCLVHGHLVPTTKSSLTISPN